MSEVPHAKDDKLPMLIMTIPQLMRSEFCLQSSV
jgi:hypothetical protein